MIKQFYGKPAAAVVIIFSTLILGVLQFQQLPIALYPDTSKPEVHAYLNTGAMAAKEFESKYGKDIETALRAIKGVEKVIGEYHNGSANFSTEFVWRVDGEEAKTDVRNALGVFEGQFPRHWGNFHVNFAGQYNSRFFLSLTSSTISTEELTELATKTLEPQLKMIDGLADVWITDFDRKDVRVTLNPDRLTQLGMTVSDVRRALTEREYDRSLGVLELNESNSLQVTASLKGQSLEDLRKFIVGHNQRSPVLLEQVATVTLHEETPEQFFRVDGKRSLLVGGYAEPDANIKYVADEFDRIVREQTAAVSRDIKVDEIMSPAAFINDAIDNVLMSVVAGILITTLVTFLFLSSVRDTIVICVAIPLAGIGGFILMKIFGIEINLISLGAMALATGMVVDGSTVVLENIVRHMQDGSGAGKPKLEIILAAMREVAAPVIASTLTTIIVFAPLPFTSPLASAILGDLAVVMVCVMAVSVVVTLLFVPPLVILVRSGREVPERNHGIYRSAFVFNRVFRRSQGLYIILLAKLLHTKKAPWVFVASTVVLLTVGGYVLLNHVQREVMATPDTDKLLLFLEMSGKSKLEDADKIVQKYERDIRDEFGSYILHTFSEVGEWDNFVMVILKDKADVKKLKAKFQERFKDTPLVRFEVIDWVPTSLELPNPPLVKVMIAGRNESARRELIEKVLDKLRHDDRIGDRDEQPQLRRDDFLKMHIDEDKLARLTSAAPGAALDRTLLTDMVGDYLSETPIMEVDFADEPMNLYLKLPEKYFSASTDLDNLLVRIGTKAVPLRSFARFEQTSDWSQYYSENAQAVAFVKAWQKTGEDGGKSEISHDKLAKEIEKTLLADPGIDRGRISFADTMTEINDNIESLAYALILAILLIYIVVTIQFGSIVQANIVMLAIPLGFIGVAFSLWVFSSTLSINSMLGLILLCGTAVNNSIIFVDFYNKLRESSQLSVADALLETARLRYRPICITTLTTILGMLPIAFGIGSGAEILQPLGIAVCGGLGISTILTILAVPMAINFAETWQGAFAFKSFLKRALPLLMVGMLASTVSFPSAGADSRRLLDLPTAVKRALDADTQVRILESAAGRSRYDQKQLAGSLLPRVAVKRELLQTKTRYEDAVTADGEIKNGVETERSITNTLVVEETIPNPIKFYNSLRILQNNESISLYRRAEAKAAVIASVRLQYFTVQGVEQALQNARRNLEIARQNFAVSQRRFAGGFIPAAEAKRTELNVRSIEAEAKQQAYKLEIEAETLAKMLGLERAGLQLTTPIPKTFRYFDAASAALAQLLGQSKSDKLERLALERTNAALATRNSRADFVPELKLSANYQQLFPDDRAVRQAGPTYVIGAEWELFAGGQSYFEFRQGIAKQYEADEELRQARLDLDLQKVNGLQRLTSLKEQYLLTKANVELMAEIVASSRQLFARGLADSKQVNDDFKQYLEEEDRLIEVSLQIIAEAAASASLLGRADLFDELI